MTRRRTQIPIWSGAPPARTIPKNRSSMRSETRPSIFWPILSIFRAGPRPPAPTAENSERRTPHGHQGGGGGAKRGSNGDLKRGSANRLFGLGNIDRDRSE